MSDPLADRRAYTQDRTSSLLQELMKAENIVKGKACVYATGSFGRLEANSLSDLDLFIVSLTEKIEEKIPTVEISRLRRLDEIIVKAELINATRKLKFPEFDGDGKYLAHHSIKEFISTLGKPEDDANNTLTGRLLLFLESKPLIGNDAYNQIIDDVIASYWRDYKDHSNDFIPAFLTNDILRLWRTFCVNYEANTQSTPEEKKIDRKIKNYKLKYSRMLTCYSALLYLLSVYKLYGTVSPENAINMTKITPTERLEWIKLEKKLSTAHSDIDDLLIRYSEFLSQTGIGKPELKEIFADKDKVSKLNEAARRFGDGIYNALGKIGQGSQFYRIIVV